MSIAILAYLLHCYTAFILIYSHDKSTICEDKESPEQNHPHHFNLTEDEIQHLSESSAYKNKDYIENVLLPRYRYFILSKEIRHYQADCNNGFKNGFFLQLFSLLLSVKMLYKAELFNTWIISLLISSIICSVSCGIIYWIYKNTWLCRDLCIDNMPHNGDSYEYLSSIKDTIIFRHSVRKILYKSSLIIFLLFFFRIPEY